MPIPAFRRISVVLLLLTAPAFARTWTDISGKYHISAELADYQGETAYLKNDSGTISRVPLAKLSAADQEFIKSTVPPVKTIVGKVIRVVDGDTLVVLDGMTQTKIRLEGIDAPEAHQAYGTKSTQALAAMVFQKRVGIEWREKDKYGRTLGHVFVDGHWVNRSMVSDGWAWHYREYSKSEVLAEAERDARSEQVGLWADVNPIPPWDFRHNEVAAREAKPTPAAESSAQARAPPPQKLVPDAPAAKPQDDVTVYVTKTGAKYHRDGCRYLKSRIPMSLSEAAKRYTPCSVCHPPSPGEQASASRLTGATAPSDSNSEPVDRNPNGEQVTGHTATGIPVFTGPRGGRYHYSKSGKKVYERRKK